MDSTYQKSLILNTSTLERSLWKHQNISIHIHTVYRKLFRQVSSINTCNYNKFCLNLTELNIERITATSRNLSYIVLVLFEDYSYVAVNAVDSSQLQARNNRYK